MKTDDNVFKPGLSPRWIDRMSVKRFGVFGEEMYVFARCHLCHKAIVPKDFIKQGGCPKCGGKKYSPTNITVFESLKFFVRLFIG